MNSALKVEMYFKDSCPYCIRAKALLEAKGISIREYPAASDQGLYEEMLRRSNGRRTFPQIFIDDKHVGGCDELHDLEKKGELDRLLSIG